MYVYKYRFKVFDQWVYAERVWDLKSDAADAAAFMMACEADEGRYPVFQLVRIKV